MTKQVSADEIDVRQIGSQHRHKVVLQRFEHLPASGTMQLVADHDPKPLRFQLATKHGAICQWTYLEEGPDVWRVRLCNKRVKETSNA